MLLLKLSFILESWWFYQSNLTRCLSWIVWWPSIFFNNTCWLLTLHFVDPIRCLYGLESLTFIWPLKKIVLSFVEHNKMEMQTAILKRRIIFYWIMSCHVKRGTTIHLFCKSIHNAPSFQWLEPFNAYYLY